MMLGKVRKRLCVCVIDNDPISRREIVEVLDSLGIYIAIVCSNLYEAIGEYPYYTLKGVPDFIISEWYPDFSDADFLTMFYDSPLAIIPIIIITESRRLEFVRVPCHMPIVGILGKPVLRRNLRSILGAV